MTSPSPRLRRRARASGLGQLPEDERENPAVPVVVELVGSVDPAGHHELLRPLLRGRLHAEPLAACAWRRVRGAGPSAPPPMSKVSFPVSPRLAASSPGSSWRGSTPIPTRLLRWIRSKLLAITARTPRRSVPLAAQSRELPVPYS